jgi:broad specificity phosphatase PhoE
MIDAHEHGGCFRGARGRDADADGTSRAIGERGMTRDEIEIEFELVDASDVPTIGWWDASRGCETVAEAQTRARGVAKYLMHKARAMAAGEEEEMDVCIVTHGMFIDMLLKTLFDVPRTRGKQGALFCSQNACVHELHLDIAEDGDSVGLQVFNDVTHIPEEARSGGTVDGLSEAYTNEGSA